MGAWWECRCESLWISRCVGWRDAVIWGRFAISCCAIGSWSVMGMVGGNEEEYLLAHHIFHGSLARHCRVQSLSWLARQSQHRSAKHPSFPRSLCLSLPLSFFYFSTQLLNKFSESVSQFARNGRRPSRPISFCLCPQIRPETNP